MLVDADSALSRLLSDDDVRPPGIAGSLSEDDVRSASLRCSSVVAVAVAAPLNASICGRTGGRGLVVVYFVMSIPMREPASSGKISHREGPLSLDRLFAFVGTGSQPVSEMSGLCGRPGAGDEPGRSHPKPMHTPTGMPMASHDTVSHPPSPTTPASRPITVKEAMAIGPIHLCRNRERGLRRLIGRLSAARWRARCRTRRG